MSLGVLRLFMMMTYPRFLSLIYLGEARGIPGSQSSSVMSTKFADETQVRKDDARRLYSSVTRYCELLNTVLVKTELLCIPSSVFSS